VIEERGTSSLPIRDIAPGNWAIQPVGVIGKQGMLAATRKSGHVEVARTNVTPGDCNDSCLSRRLVALMVAWLYVLWLAFMGTLHGIMVDPSRQCSPIIGGDVRLSSLGMRALEATFQVFHRRERNFGLAPRRARCKLVKPGGDIP
jgi:hypothetical protein